VISHPAQRGAAPVVFSQQLGCALGAASVEVESRQGNLHTKRRKLLTGWGGIVVRNGVSALRGVSLLCIVLGGGVPRDKLIIDG